MAQTKITGYIPVEITVEMGELVKCEEISAEEIAQKIAPYSIPYEDKLYKKVSRGVELGDVVLITKFGGKYGSWTRRVDRLHPDYVGDFFINVGINGSDYFDDWEDTYSAVYEPTKESEVEWLE
ncbi:hypothetical protein LL50_05280 [Listeria monocytogenes]|nr:hypothetical protein [Listeria monocytogenes]EAE9168078.1 hypothetical protein [Listeria monocytogenes]EAF2023474.1 hypothetical protein [Listeria monocytogenes]EDN8187217.1 hypothetical protein [Listeria monocytogenes]